MNLQYLTESIHPATAGLPNCSIMTLSGGGVLQASQLLPKPVKTLLPLYRQSPEVLGLFEEIPSLGGVIILQY
ncbi:hypothetical protein SDC9_45279 [bioreactor metagenome]|jgi:hypothetical protein|uniref:Uncharacterized protein n=1 Tax=bioreactor metagenome TaxID=1076179 RepID=A0A644W5K7_9ZZZZ|nr:hypothetical protein [Lentimicrobium sp.]MEA5112223.1 hypothetical protein [Lentimicrobium sp.]